MAETRVIICRTLYQPFVTNLYKKYAPLLSDDTIASVDTFCECDEYAKRFYLNKYTVEEFDLLVIRLKGKWKCQHTI